MDEKDSGIIDPFAVSKTKAAELKSFFPIGCDYYWDGQGLVPDESLILMELSNSINEVCQKCTYLECQVRQAEKEDSFSDK